MKRKKLTTKKTAGTVADVHESDDPTQVASLGVNGRLDLKLIRKFCDMIEQGMPVDLCCDYLGINSGNYWHWVRRGEKYILGDRNPESHEIYGIFVSSMKKSMAVYRMSLINNFHNNQNTPGCWQGPFTALERRDRRNFGKNDPMGGTDEQYNPDESFL